MMRLTYHLFLLVLKLKGIKKVFSKSPIDFVKLRKEDIHVPKIKGLDQYRFQVSISMVTQLAIRQNSTLVLYCHGGAFVSGPAKHHWKAVERIAKNTSATVWMVDYPKAPENKIDKILENLFDVYSKALEEFATGDIIMMGDSVGGALIVSLTQMLIKMALRTPEKLILISPVVDATLTNQAIAEIDSKDPMLSKAGVLSAKKMCSLNGDLNDPRISPIKGETNGFPPTHLFVAQNDITAPDQTLFLAKMKKDKVDVKFYYENKMPHIWPILPFLGQGKKDFDTILKIINE